MSNRHHAACGDCGYRVHRQRHYIESLSCRWCPLSVGVLNFRRAGDRSGRGRYNRARAAILKHIYAEHSLQVRAAITACNAARDPIVPGGGK